MRIYEEYDGETKMIFVEMMSPRGHVRLNQFYLSKLWEEGDVLLTGASLVGFFDGFSPVTLEDKPYGSPMLNRLGMLVQILRKLPYKTVNRDICFLSYDLFWFPVISIYLRMCGFKIHVFEHNTTPTTRLKRYFQRLSGKTIQHLTYTPFVENFFRTLNLTAKTIPHPILRSVPIMKNDGPEIRAVLGKKKNFNRIIFCPSASVNWEQLEPMVKRYPLYLFVVKSPGKYKLANVITFPYFEAYFEILTLCDYVYIPFNRDDKVSGPFFEAMGFGKTVIMKPNVFGMYAQSKFPSHVVFEDDDWETIESSTDPIDILGYNDLIVQNLRMVFER